MPWGIEIDCVLTIIRGGKNLRIAKFFFIQIIGSALGKAGNGYIELLGTGK